METTLSAGLGGKVKKTFAAAGDSLTAGDLIVEIE
jgi:biotin carboxyl carrier protein